LRFAQPRSYARVLHISLLMQLLSSCHSATAGDIFAADSNNKTC
jgi:hypothetical protein